MANYIFTGGYTDGLILDYLGDQFHGMFSYNDGINENVFGSYATGHMPALTPDTDFAFTVRGEWLAMGTWDQFMDFTSPSGEETGVMVGGAIHWQTSEDDSPAVVDVETLILTLDGSFEFGGGSLFASYTYADQDVPTGAPFGDLEQSAILVQGGYYITDEWEGFLRYEWADLDATTLEDVNILTVGATRYFAGHNAKWTTDLGFAMDEVSLAPGITGYRDDGPDEDGQVVIRTQLQIVF